MFGRKCHRDKHYIWIPTHIWGYAGSKDVVYNEYDLVSDQPVSASADGSYYFTGVLESSHSSATAGNFAIYAEGGRWSARASGESYYEFTSDFEHLISDSKWIHLWYMYAWWSISRFIRSHNRHIYFHLYLSILHVSRLGLFIPSCWHFQSCWRPTYRLQP